jgi:hypothetical protein
MYVVKIEIKMLTTNYENSATFGFKNKSPRQKNLIRSHSEAFINVSFYVKKMISKIVCKTQKLFYRFHTNKL